MKKLNILPIWWLLTWWLLTPPVSFAAISATAVWEVRASGSDSNGGGFDPGVGSPGTDFSKQNSAQQAYTDIVIGGTTTQATSAAHAFDSTHPGNFINITGGSGCTVQIVEILSQSSGTITVDKSLGTAASTCTGNLGGGLASLGKVTSSGYVAGNDIWVSGTLAVATATTTFSVAGAAATPIRIMGYGGTTRGDGVQATVSTNTNSITNLLTISNNYYKVSNLILDCNSKTSCSALNATGSLDTFSNITLKNFTVKGATFQGNGHLLLNSLVTGGVSGCTAGINTQGRVAIRATRITANVCPGISVTSGAGLNIARSIVDANSGASSDGIQLGVGPGTSSPNLVEFCDIYNNGRDGIHGNSAVALLFDETTIRNNIITGNAGWGINNAGSTTYSNASVDQDYNAYFNNTSGAVTGVPAGSHDVTLTGTPYTNAASGDFSLNNAAGAGASCRQAGFPGVIGPGGTTTSYLDIGAAGVQNTGGESQKACAFVQ